jgi:hypothetical protein
VVGIDFTGLKIMQRKEGHKYRLNGRGRRKISERKLSNYFSDLFSTYMDS